MLWLEKDQRHLFMDRWKRLNREVREILYCCVLHWWHQYWKSFFCELFWCQCIKKVTKKLPESRRKGLEDSNNLISLAYQNKGGADLIVLWWPNARYQERSLIWQRKGLTKGRSRLKVNIWKNCNKLPKTKQQPVCLFMSSHQMQTPSLKTCFRKSKLFFSTYK